MEININGRCCCCNYSMVSNSDIKIKEYGDNIELWINDCSNVASIKINKDEFKRMVRCL